MSTLTPARSNLAPLLGGKYTWPRFSFCRPPSGARELGNAELLPVGMGCHAGDALEQATEECVAFVADLPADFLHGCGGALQAPLGVFNAQSLDVLDGSQPGGGSEPPLECRSEEHTSELQSLMRISY